jgi:hypothetical protein
MDIVSFIIFFSTISLILYILWSFINYIMYAKNRSAPHPYNANSNINRVSDQDEECSICTEAKRNKVELDCGHSFCGHCIMDYYNTLTTPELKCPLCRQHIRLINPLDIQRNEQTRVFYDAIVTYNHKHLQGIDYVNYLF